MKSRIFELVHFLEYCYSPTSPISRTIATVYVKYFFDINCNKSIFPTVNKLFKMKTLFWIFLIGFTLVGISCDCNDCGSTGYTRYYMINSTNQQQTLTWFGNTTLPSNIAHEFVIDEDEKVLLYESSLDGTTGQISTPPFGSTYPFDSLRIASDLDSMTYIKDECEQLKNPLCEENFELVESVDTKDQKIKVWEFQIIK